MPRRHLASAGLCAVLALALGAGCASAPAKRAGKPKTTVLMTEYDDARVGRETSKQVEDEMGVLGDAALAAYVDGIGRKLLRGVPRRGFDYRFFVVDMLEPNAFALPGGYIFVSRGLLLLANDEDELACVIGHEITHAARRHAAAQQALEKSLPPLAMPGSRAVFASYSREMEREADAGGQTLCAAAGYDPMALSTFLNSLAMATRLRQGESAGPGFFDTHPGSEERAAANAVHAREMRWQRDPALGDPRAALLRHLDGLEVGQRPEVGVFEGDLFVHPALGFALRFPPGWKKSNGARAVGAEQPRGEAVVFLTADVPPGDVGQVAQAWVERGRETTRLEVRESKPVKVGAIDAWRVDASAAGGGGSLRAQITFIPFREATWRVTGVAPASLASRHAGTMLGTARSFRPISDEERRSIRVTRLRVETARAGESLVALGQRSGSAWSPAESAVQNALFPDHRFEGGELVKVAREEPYIPR